MTSVSNNQMPTPLLALMIDVTLDQALAVTQSLKGHRRFYLTYWPSCIEITTGRWETRTDVRDVKQEEAARRRGGQQENFHSNGIKAGWISIVWPHLLLNRVMLLNPIWHGLFLNRQSWGHEGPHHNFVVIAPMIMKFGTGVKLDVFYTTVTKKFVTSLLLRHYDVITCILADS